MGEGSQRRPSRRVSTAPAYVSTLALPAYLSLDRPDDLRATPLAPCQRCPSLFPLSVAQKPRSAIALARTAGIARTRWRRADSPCAACQPQCGLSRKARAKATMSALPSVTMASACFAVVIMPTVRTTMPVSRRSRWQSARCNPGCSASGCQPSHRPKRRRCDRADVLERFAERHRIVRRETAVRPSLPVMRAPSGTPRGTTARTARTTSSGKRMRLASDPPHSSLRLLASGESQLCRR